MFFKCDNYYVTQELNTNLVDEISISIPKKSRMSRIPKYTGNREFDSISQDSLEPYQVWRNVVPKSRQR